MTAAVHVYYADRRALPEDFAAQLVTAEDRQRAQEAMAPRRVGEYLAGRALLRHALECFTQRAGASWRIVADVDGKPECVGGPAISLSHSGTSLVCAVAASGDIGIDVETRGPRTAVAGIAERYFTPAEAAWVAADAERRFRMLWVLKEAYLKALGTGLAGGLATLECRIEPPLIVARTGSGSVPRLTLWSGRGCHVGLAATAAAPATIEVRRWSLGTEPDAVGPLELLAATA